MKALLEFVNTSSWDNESLASFYARHDIHYSIFYGKLGKECIFWDYYYRHELDMYSFCFTEIDEVKAYHYKADRYDPLTKTIDMEKKISNPSDHYTIFPDEERYNVIWTVIEDIRLYFLGFIEKCCSQMLDISFINKMLSLYAEYESIEHVGLLQSNDYWNPSLKIEFRGGSGLREWIFHNEILHPLINGGGPLFSKIKKCKQCKKYYLAKSKKSIFCSDSCRGAHHYAHRS